MSKPNTLFVSMVCHSCRSSIEVANRPEFAPYVEIVDVNTKDGYQKMQDAGIAQTPMMSTPSGIVSGPREIYEYLKATCQ